MKEIRLYVEGGGDSKAQKTALRQGFDDFLREFKGSSQDARVSLRVITCGPRGETFKHFDYGREDNPQAIALLLVDSEGPVTAPSPKQHLTTRDGCSLSGVADDRVHLMVQMMEAWLVADKDCLATYYGQGFNANALSARRNVEDIPKTELEPGLKAATAKSRKGEYHKTRHAPELLGKVDPAKVRQAAPHCEALFTTLEGLLADA